jgi:hypothetical protein
MTEGLLTINKVTCIFDDGRGGKGSEKSACEEG